MISIQQTGQNRFLYPYNFVRVNEAVPPEREKPASHGWLDPARYSGKFKVKVSLESPLFVPAAEPCEVTEREGKSHERFRFCRGEDGAPRLPETSIKGALRSTFEALTNSCFAVFGSAERHVGLRYNPKRERQLASVFFPGRVVAATGESGLAIQPCTHVRTGSVINSFRPNSKVSSPLAGIVHRDDLRRADAYEREARRDDSGPYLKHGWLLRPVPDPVFDAHKRDRLFWARPNGPTLGLPRKVVEAYNAVVQQQRKLVGEGFEIRTGTSSDLHDLAIGDLVYYRKSTDLRYGFELSRTAIPRVSSDWSIGDLLPAGHHACTKGDSLCPACRVFGWVNSAGPGAYAGNVRILPARWVGRPLPAQPPNSAFTELRIQGTPHPESANLYVVDKHEQNEVDVEYQHSVPDSPHKPAGKLRGRKRYWVRNTQRPQDWTMPARHPYHEKDQSIHAELLPTGAGHFEFEVRFENLTDVELGALLFTVELPWEDTIERPWRTGPGKHTLGRGKPLGLGVVAMSVIGGVELLDIASRYGEKLPGQHKDKAQFLKAWRQNAPAATAAARQDLQRLTTPVNVSVRYPRFVGPTAADQGTSTFGWFCGSTRSGARFEFELNDTNRRRINRRDLPLPLPAEAPTQLLGGDDGGLPNS